MSPVLPQDGVYCLIFLIFDIESVFLVPFAVAFTDLPVGAFVAMLVFMFSLYGLSGESAIALSLLILLMSTLWRGLGSLAFPLLGRFKKDDIAAEHNSTGEKLK